jgi:hypothetical protein
MIELARSGDEAAFTDEKRIPLVIPEKGLLIDGYTYRQLAAFLAKNAEDGLSAWIWLAESFSWLQVTSTGTALGDPTEILEGRSEMLPQILFYKK